MECLNCGKDIDESLFPSGLTYCPYCGQDLTSSREGLGTDRLLFCPYCGQELIGRTKFCPHCGKELLKPGMAPSGKHETKEFIGHAADTIKSTFGPERKLKKLYKQWSEHAGLPDEEIPSLLETAREVPAERRVKARNLSTLYIVLAVAIVIFIIGLALLIWYLTT